MKYIITIIHFFLVLMCVNFAHINAMDTLECLNNSGEFNYASADFAPKYFDELIDELSNDVTSESWGTFLHDDLDHSPSNVAHQSNTSVIQEVIEDHNTQVTLPDKTDALKAPIVINIDAIIATRLANATMTCCQRYFNSDENYRRHFQAHHASSSGGYNCPSCNINFIDRAQIAYHHRLHLDPSLYSCPLPGCNTQCGGPYGLRTHYKSCVQQQYKPQFVSKQKKRKKNVQGHTSNKRQRVELSALAQGVMQAFDKNITQIHTKIDTNSKKVLPVIQDTPVTQQIQSTLPTQPLYQVKQYYQSFQGYECPVCKVVFVDEGTRCNHHTPTVNKTIPVCAHCHKKNCTCNAECDAHGMANAQDSLPLMSKQKVVFDNGSQAQQELSQSAMPAMQFAYPRLNGALLPVIISSMSVTNNNHAEHAQQQVSENYST